MRYGFYLPTRGPAATSEGLTAIVQRGEALGFHSVVVADHIVFSTLIRSSYPYTVSGEFPGEGDALVLLPLMASVVVVTKRLRLEPIVVILPLRYPVVPPTLLATID